MKRRFNLCKADLTTIHQMLRKALKTCQCNYSSLDPCTDCARTLPVFDKLEVLVGKNFEQGSDIDDD